MLNDQIVKIIFVHDTSDNVKIIVVHIKNKFYFN